MHMGLSNHALYQMAIKALVIDNDKVLVLFKSNGSIHFPGGRVDETERNIPWEEALLREVAEETGETLQLDIGPTIFVGKRQYTKADTTHHIATIFFRCNYLGGDVELSDEHARFAWLDLSRTSQTRRQVSFG